MTTSFYVSGITRQFTGNKKLSAYWQTPALTIKNTFANQQGYVLKIGVAGGKD